MSMKISSKIFLSRAEQNESPFAAPKVEQATPNGTIQAKSLNTFAPNVVATALYFN